MLGGTVAGVAAAKSLCRIKGLHVALVAEKDHFELLPPFNEVAMDKDRIKLQQTVRDFHIPYTTIFANTGVQVVVDTVKLVYPTKVYLTAL